MIISQLKNILVFLSFVFVCTSIFVFTTFSQEKVRVKKSKTGTQIYFKEDNWISWYHDPSFHDAVVDQDHVFNIPSGTVVVIKIKHDDGSKDAYAEVQTEISSETIYMYLSALEIPKSKTATVKKIPRKEQYMVRKTNVGWVIFASDKDAVGGIVLCYKTGMPINNGGGWYYQIQSGAIGTKLDETIIDGYQVVQLKLTNGFTGWTIKDYLRKME
jgi:hypothetical protein